MFVWRLHYALLKGAFCYVDVTDQVRFKNPLTSLPRSGFVQRFCSYLSERVAYGLHLSSNSRTDQSGASYFPIVVRRSVTANVRPMHFDFKVDFN
jgi:hypothetical protein